MSEAESQKGREVGKRTNLYVDTLDHSITYLDVYICLYDVLWKQAAEMEMGRLDL